MNERSMKNLRKTTPNFHVMEIKELMPRMTEGLRSNNRSRCEEIMCMGHVLPGKHRDNGNLMKEKTCLTVLGGREKTGRF